MIPAPQLLSTFRSNHMLAVRHLEGLDEGETLLTPSFQANSLNWLLGHIVNGRAEALKHLGRLFLWPGEAGERYRTGSDPIEAETAVPLSELLKRFNESQEAIEAALAEGPEAYLQEVVPTRFGEQPRWQHISGLAWHETYHVGQMELLRQLALDSRSGEIKKYADRSA